MPRKQINIGLSPEQRAQVHAAAQGCAHPGQGQFEFGLVHLA